MYFVREAFTSFRRNWVMSTAATSTVALSLLVAGIFMFTAVTVNNIIQVMERKFEVVVYLKDNAVSTDIDTLQKEILAWSEVERVKFVTKEEAMARLREDLKDQPGILEAIETNPLPPSFEIKLNDARRVGIISKRLKGRPAVDEVRDSRALVDRAIELFDFLRRLGVVLIVGLIFAAMALISQTVRLAIFARRREIGIMKLVGASNWFIRWPFLLEGIMEGLIGAALAVGMLYLGYAWFKSIAANVIRFLPVSFDMSLFWSLAGYLTLSGVLVGALASIIALWRFLRV